MKSVRLRSLLLTGVFAVPALAHAHPGHEGDHELVWDLGHLISHPLATVAAALLVIAAGWALWCLLRSDQSVVPPAQQPASRRR